jgi:maltodextrin utilization protein YvdJ
MGLLVTRGYTRLNNKFRSDLTDLKLKMEQLAGGNEDCIDSSKLMSMERTDTKLQ